MTSTLKFGTIGLVVAGVGLGAYFVNLGLKKDKAGTTAAEPAPIASPDTGQGLAGAVTEEPVPAPALQPVTPPPSPIVSTNQNTGHEASPAPIGVHENREDAARSWRPKPLETSVSQPPAAVTPGADPASHARTGDPVPVGVVANSVAGLPAPVAPVAAESSRMSLQEQPTATQPAHALGAGTVKPAQPSPAPEKTTIHVVQAGDTFSSLAAKYLGSSKHVNLIEKANPKINPNRLYVGTKLKIPAAPAVAPETGSGNTALAGASGAQKPKTIAAPPVNPAKAYTVKPGDSWSSLARQHLGDANWTVLYEYNKERFPGNSRALREGMVIEIPTKDEVAGKK